MNDETMYVWNVMLHEPYEGAVCIFSCAKQETAIHLRDWCEAVEENRCFDLSVRYYGQPNCWVGNKNVYNIEESEVIL